MLDMINILKFLIIFIYGCIIGCASNMLADGFVKKILDEEEQENNNSMVRKKSYLYFKNFTFDCGCIRKGLSLVPVLGYFLVKGKCPVCNKKINKRYIIVEIITGVLFVINVLVNGFNVVSFLNCLVIAALVILSVVDFKIYEIPVEINYFILFIGIIVSIYDIKNVFEHLIGFLAISVFTWVLMYISNGAAIGGGDVKLMATCGLLLGWKVIIVAFILGCIFGSVIHSIRMAIEKEKSMLAFGPYLSMGVFVGMLYGPAIIEWYLGLIK